jgi:hypothetical protein
MSKAQAGGNSGVAPENGEGGSSAPSQAAVQPPTAPARIGLPTKLFYGLGSVAFGVESVALGSLVLLFFNQVIGLPAPWVGAAIMIALIFDAVFDPLVGQWSDHVRSRWGRRHPFMYASAIPLAIAFYYLWNPPYHWSNQSMFAYLLVLLVAVRLLVSLYEIPSAALAPELTPDYDERTGLLSYRFFFGTLGGTVMAVLAFQVFLRKDATHPMFNGADSIRGPEFDFKPNSRTTFSKANRECLTISRADAFVKPETSRFTTTACWREGDSNPRDSLGFDGEIWPELGALFGPKRSIRAGENVFAWNSAPFRLSPELPMAKFRKADFSPKIRLST